MLSARCVPSALALSLFLAHVTARAQTFTLEQVLSAPFASEVIAAPEGRRFAWISYDQGRRNVWLASATGSSGSFRSRPLTHYAKDDGLDLGDLAFVPRRGQVLYVRGEDFENPDKPSPNPAQIPGGVSQEVYLVGFEGGAPTKLGEGHSPLASPDGERILFLHENQVISLANRKGAKREVLFKVRGTIDSLRFSPSGRQFAFVCTRVDHSFIAVYTFADRSLRWIDASLGYDVEPRWSPDGTRLAFLRLPSTHDEVGLVPHRTGSPWSIRVATLSGNSVAEVYRAPAGAGSVFHPLSSDTQIFWTGDQLVFPAENDGWLHLYSVPATGGAARLLTPGRFEIEYASASPDGSAIVYASNTNDIDQRHLWLLRPAEAAVSELTSGAGIETQPSVLADGTSVAFLRSDARTPAHAALLIRGATPSDFFAEGLPPAFPAAALVAPTSVQLPETAGIAAHAQLFLPSSATQAERHPALVFMHGGPIRQMLVGWHYMHYYSNAYALNQYLASRGYVVLALNYRAGIGYGLDYREAPGIGAAGASEYNDLLAAASYLRARADVDPRRIGLWGGSYGGYMTALGLTRNSDLFVAGVDFHGVHDWYHWTLGERGNAPLYVLDTPPAVLDTALAASPIGSIGTWRSPVLLVHGDDDRNVVFSESVRLAEALRKQGVDYSELIFPDEVHDFLRHASWLRAYTATADFLDSKVAGKAAH
ncbi:MAG TPA: prolyl oligopeptidase family serine peptidase [Steroidobacteraceae bacterium]|nr:prolyl oligopeptidase family serine peptidase [Steroidobacteraceae bacterium]